MRASSIRRAALLVALGLLSSPALAGPEPATRVFLNGVPAPVFFNDGDSFRVLDGPLKGSKARLAGFNTLESYGPVHSWGGWTADELYINAKMGTLNAQRGEWHCEGDVNDKDGYGRVLWHCKDLAIDQLKKGLAHAMTVTAEPADPDLLAAQHEAMKARRGMWAHGVPAYVLTSLHSVTEGGGSDGRTYNRLVSTADGHSEKWIHDSVYSECEKVCHVLRPLDAATLRRLVDAARPELPEAFAELSDRELARRIQNTVDIGHAGWMETKEESLELTEILREVLDDNAWKPSSAQTGACMVYVDFKRRYGSKRASCLKK